MSANTPNQTMTEHTTTFRRLLESLSRDLRTLLAQSMGLARAEASESIRAVILYVAVAMVGVVVLVGGLLVLLAALVLIAVTLGLPPWAAASLVGLLLAGLGAGTAYFCIASLQAVPFGFPRTRRSVKETLAWLKTQAVS